MPAIGLRAAWLAACMLLAPPLALAQPAPTTGLVQVRAQIVGGCRVSTQPAAVSGVDFGDLDFGSQPALFGVALEAQALQGGSAVLLRCLGVPGVNVSVGLGLDPAGNQRRMSAGSHRVPYTLYADNSFSLPFLGEQPRAFPLAPGGQEVELALPIYGRVEPVPGGYPAGQYSDRVAITVSW